MLERRFKSVDMSLTVPEVQPLMGPLGRQDINIVGGVTGRHNYSTKRIRSRNNCGPVRDYVSFD